MKTRLPILLTILGLLLAIGSIVTVAVIDRPLAGGRPVSFTASTGDRLVGTYHPGTQEVGVILLEGFGSDQLTMRSLASEFARGGWHVFTFDFSGHGRSPGALTFDNASTDRLAYQALSALDEFERLSGLRADQIFVVGHSLGARVALQSATMNPEPVAGLVLLGTQVNLSTNVQSEFFTGTTDADLPWVQALGPENPPVPILLISGSWDDILTPAGAEMLIDKLTDSRYVMRGYIYQSETVRTEMGSARQQYILPFLFHNYEPFSPRAIAETKGLLHFFARFHQCFDAGIPAGADAGEYCIDHFSPVSDYMDFMDAAPSSTRIFGWLLGFAGLLLTIFGGAGWARATSQAEELPLNVEVTSVKRLLWGKLLLWLAALPVAAILGSLFFVIPLGKPVFNLIYVGFIGGYGVLLAILYGRGKMPGVKGRLPFTALSGGSERKRVAVVEGRLLAALAIAAGMLVLTAAYARTGWIYVFPLNVRLFWLVLFTPVTALGFWIGAYEARMVKQAGGRGGSQAALTLIGLFPFFVYTVLMAAIGSLSGMLGGLQGLLVLALILGFGGLVGAVGRRPWLAAICQAVLLYWLILPQGVLF